MGREVLGLILIGLLILGLILVRTWKLLGGWRF
jgi:hypothetical protein